MAKTFVVYTRSLFDKFRACCIERSSQGKHALNRNNLSINPSINQSINELRLALIK